MIALLYAAGFVLNLLYGICGSIGMILAGLGGFAAFLALLDGSYAQAAASALVPLPFSDDEENYEPVTIIYQTTEDDADDTVVPRFNAAGGDSERLSAAQRFFFFR